MSGYKPLKNLLNRTFKKRVLSSCTPEVITVSRTTTLEEQQFNLHPVDSIVLTENISVNAHSSHQSILNETNGSFSIASIISENISANIPDVNLTDNIPSKHEICLVEEMKSRLRSWAVEYSIPHCSINSLLSTLRFIDCLKNLPKDARTLLRTPRTSYIISVDGGKYFHVGVERAILAQISHFGIIPDVILININIDGLPLSKSSSSQFWPILGKIKTDEYDLPPFIIGVFHGYSKPTTTSFLEPFVDELLEIMHEKIVLNDKFVAVLINAILCDAPCKSFICACKGHTGHNGCQKCTIEGVYLCNRICFPGINFIKRTDKKFRSRDYDDYVRNTPSVLEKLPIDMVSQFLLDYLHLLCVGVMKKLTYLWLQKGPLSCRLSKNMVKNINVSILKAEKSQPKEFNRRIRTFQHIGHFKGTEFRTLIMYVGPIVLKNILPKKNYDHFLHLHCATRILIDSKKYLIFTNGKERK